MIAERLRRIEAGARDEGTLGSIADELEALEPKVLAEGKMLLDMWGQPMLKEDGSGLHMCIYPIEEQPIGATRRVRILAVEEEP